MSFVRLVGDRDFRALLSGLLFGIKLDLLRSSEFFLFSLGLCCE